MTGVISIKKTKKKKKIAQQDGEMAQIKRKAACFGQNGLWAAGKENGPQKVTL